MPEANKDISEALAAGDSGRVIPMQPPPETPGQGAQPSSASSIFDEARPIGEMPDALDPERAAPPPMLLQASDGPVIPHGHVTLLAACGGTGKSFLTLQLAASVATGEPWLARKDGEQGFEPDSNGPGKVLLWSAEDSWQIANYRLAHIARHLRLDTELMGQNIVGLFGKAAPLAARNDSGGLCAMPDHHGLCRTIREGGFALVIIDSLALIAPGDTEKDNALAHRFIREYLEGATLAAKGKPPPAIVVTHHTSKPSGRDKPDQHSIRGASGIVNGARDALLLTPLEMREGHPPLVRCAHVKGNLGPQLPDRLLMWEGHSCDGHGSPYLCTATESVVDAYHAAAKSDAMAQPKRNGARKAISQRAHENPYVGGGP